MAERTRLYTPFRPPRTNETENASRRINVVVMDIDQNDFLINNRNIQIKRFSKAEIDSCVDYIKSELTNVYLFISSDVGNTLIPSIHDCEQINSIYILDKHDKYSYTNRNIERTFDDIGEMIQQFGEDIMLLTINIYPEKSTLQNINPESGEVLWWKCFDKILQYIHHTSIARDEFIAFSRQWFAHNQGVLGEIEEYENAHRPNNACWYTGYSVLYRLVNQTLRTTNNLNNLFKLRLFLTDIMIALKNAQRERNLHNITDNSLRLCRSQMFRTPQEIENLKSAVGNSIVFNQFLSTTSADEQAVLVSARDLCANSPLKFIFFSITIDSLNPNSGDPMVIADITPFNPFGGVSEVLFSMHSKFLVRSVEFIENNMWRVDLKFEDNVWDAEFDERSIFSPHPDEIFVRDLSEENKQFIAFQVLLDLILRLDQTPYAKAELLEFCRSKYQNDLIELNKIGDFERNYQSENAAKWYTKDGFLHRLLNKSLRIERIDCIVKLRYYIYDLHNQLVQLQDDPVQSLNEKTNLTLYRGQPMKDEELSQIKKNRDGLISMNSFLSATQDIAVAFFFSGDGQTTEAGEVSVIYEMLIDTNIRSTPYAKIESVISNEEEILFSMGATFRIGYVDEILDHPGVFRIKLTMVHIEDQFWNKLTAHLD